MMGGEIIGEADDLVDQEGGRLRRKPPGRGRREQSPFDLGAPGLERLFEQRHHCAAARTRVAAFPGDAGEPVGKGARSEEHTSELQSLMRISYAVFCLKKKNSN